MISLLAVLMLKNEEARILITLNSLLHDDIPIIDGLVIYDTGSTDKTLDIVQDWCEKNNIPLHLKIGEFENFSISRNILLDFADETIYYNCYYLLMDANDELKNGHKIKDYLNNSKSDCFMIVQHLKAGNESIVFKNYRVIKAGSDWRYKGIVHEYLDGYGTKEIIPDEIEIYQDRFKDVSKNRQLQDKQLLLKEMEISPSNTRNMFYLAQTLSDLGEISSAREWYIKRSRYENFPEERWLSILKAGILGIKLKLDFNIFVLPWLMQAAEMKVPDLRAEPLLEMAKWYQKKEIWDLAFLFSKLSCERKEPVDSILFYDKNLYNYERWHVLGICSYYVNEKTIGKMACECAIKSKNLKIDNDNLKFYL